MRVSPGVRKNRPTHHGSHMTAQERPESANVPKRDVRPAPFHCTGKSLIRSRGTPCPDTSSARPSFCYVPDQCLFPSVPRVYIDLALRRPGLTNPVSVCRPGEQVLLMQRRIRPRSSPCVETGRDGNVTPAEGIGAAA